MFFASNYFYAYQSAVNTARFDSATRALNATLESSGSIVGALLIGYFCLDLKGLRRRTRGYLGLATVAIVVAVVWSVGLAWQVTFTRADLNDANRINYHDDNYKGKGALFFFCGSRAYVPHKRTQSDTSLQTSSHTPATKR